MHQQMVDWKWLTATRRGAFENGNLNDAHLSSHRSKNSFISFRWKCGQRHKIDAGVFVICTDGRHVNECDVFCISLVLPIEHTFECRLTRHQSLTLASNNRSKCPKYQLITGQFLPWTSTHITPHTDHLNIHPFYFPSILQCQWIQTQELLALLTSKRPFILFDK